MQFNRRQFLSAVLVGSTGAFFYFKGQKLTLFESRVQLLLATAYHIYPSSSFGFGAKELHLASYLTFVLDDQRILKGDRAFLLKGPSWIEEVALKAYKKSFLILTTQEKESLLQKVVTYKWGYNYINFLFTYIFEALFSAPIYGGNPNEIGWKWAEHNPGFPQPQSKEAVSYV